MLKFKNLIRWHREVRRLFSEATTNQSPDLSPIGLPRALFYFLYPELWEAFFRSLGLPVVVSAPTSQITLERASLISETEHCLPVKILDAHLEALAGKVTRVFVPRILSQHAGFIACPKLAALPDAVQAQFGDQFEVVTLDVDENKKSLDQTLTELGKQLGFRHAAVQFAVRVAMETRVLPPRTPPPSGKGMRILMIGHPYNLNDENMSEMIYGKLASMGVVTERMTFDGALDGAGPLRWDTSAHILQRLQGVNSDRFAGVIQLSSFNCGCDSMADVYYRETLKNAGIPYMVLILDTHSAQAGLETRLEAFVDSIEGIL